MRGSLYWSTLRFTFQRQQRSSPTLVIYLRQTPYIVPECHCPSRFTNSSVLPADPYPRINVWYAWYRFHTIKLHVYRGKNLTYFLKASRVHNGPHYRLQHQTDMPQNQCYLLQLSTSTEPQRLLRCRD